MPDSRAGSGDQLPCGPIGATDVAALISALHHRNGAVRQHAREMLVAMGGSAVSALLPLLKEPGYLIRWEAARTLGEIGDERAAPALVEALEDPQGDVRWLAAEGLVAMGRGGLLALLRRLSRGCGALFLRQGAHHVLHSFLESPLRGVAEPVLRAMGGPFPQDEVPMAARRASDRLLEMGTGRR